MSRKASELQFKVMSLSYRGKGIFKPMNTGYIDERVACVREYIANIFFYTRNGTTIMIDAGYSYDRLEEKMGWLDIDPKSIKHILITHQDTDHVGAVETDSAGLFRDAKLYLSEIENRYLTGEVRRRVYFGTYKLPLVKTDNEKVLLGDGDVFYIDDIKIEAILVPGHTFGHIDYLIDDEYLFTGDTIWFGADGGYSFINTLAEDNKLSVESLKKLEKILRERGLKPKIITGHTGWTDDLDLAFRYSDKVCRGFFKQKPVDPEAPYDGYIEDDDTEEKARSQMIPKKSFTIKPNYKNWVPMHMITGGWTAFSSAVTALVSFFAAGKNINPKVRKTGILVSGLFALLAGVFAGICTLWYRAFDYNGKRKMSKQIIDGIAAHVDLPEGGKGLDVGCGSGALTIAVARRNPQAQVVGLDRWGIEYASYNKELCESNAAAENVSNTSFVQGDACRLDFPDETFDAVTSNYVYHNIPGVNKQKLLQETLRVLKKGGTFAIHDIMTPGRYGDMEAFARELYAEGYEDVQIIDTSKGMFMTEKEGKILGLAGSTLLLGKK